MIFFFLLLCLLHNSKYKFLNSFYIHSQKVSFSVFLYTPFLLHTNIPHLPHTSQTYHTLTLVSRDSLALLTAHMERIIMEKIRKLQDTTRIQVCVCDPHPWLSNQRSKAPNHTADVLLHVVVECATLAGGRY